MSQLWFNTNVLLYGFENKQTNNVFFIKLWVLHFSSESWSFLNIGHYQHFSQHVDLRYCIRCWRYNYPLRRTKFVHFPPNIQQKADQALTCGETWVRNVIPLWFTCFLPCLKPYVSNTRKCLLVHFLYCLNLHHTQLIKCKIMN